MYLNISQCYRVGPGPSSSQTVAPLEAARRFVHELAADGLVTRTARVRVELFGGLACTGRELGAQRAVVAGLAGIPTATCDGALLARCTADADNDRAIALAGRHRIDFHPAREVVDEGVERQDGENCVDGFGASQVLHPEEIAVDGGPRHLVGGEVRVRDHQRIALKPA